GTPRATVTARAATGTGTALIASAVRALATGTACTPCATAGVQQQRTDTVQPQLQLQVHAVATGSAGLADRTGRRFLARRWCRRRRSIPCRCTIQALGEDAHGLSDPRLLGAEPQSAQPAADAQ